MMRTQLGKVYLIGAGPGASDLMTIRGARLLAQAQIVFYDALVDSSMLELCPQAKLVAVGKRCGKLSTAQKFIDKQLVDAAQKYQHIVRLKGGDPMIFGRADEEITALQEHGIELEVVPGITSALAAAASVQSSLTLRGVARSVAFITVVKANETSDIEQTPQADTLIYYMGRKDSEKIATQLIDQGRSKLTPVIVIEAISTSKERKLFTHLSDLQSGILDQWSHTDSPTIIMIGEAFYRVVQAQQDKLDELIHREINNRLQDQVTLPNSRRRA
jgi:uroporphyrin-III C-methyltransferase